MILRILYALIPLILCPSSMYANAGWAGIFLMFLYFNNPRSALLAIVPGFLIELIVMKSFFRKTSMLKLVGITALMNAASATIGLAAIALLDLMNVITFFAMRSYIQHQSVETILVAGYFAIFCIITLLVNTFIEFFIARFFLIPENTKRFVGWLLFANTLSFLADIIAVYGGLYRLPM